MSLGWNCCCDDEGGGSTCPIDCCDLCGPCPETGIPNNATVTVEGLSCSCDGYLSSPFVSMPCPDPGNDNYNGTFECAQTSTAEELRCHLFYFDSYTYTAFGLTNTQWWGYEIQSATIDHIHWGIAVFFGPAGFMGSGFTPMIEWIGSIDCSAGGTFDTPIELPLVYTNPCWTVPSTVTIGCPSSPFRFAADATTRKPLANAEPKKPCNCGGRLGTRRTSRRRS